MLRPFIAHGIDKLEAICAENETNQPVLEGLLHELNKRKTHRARRLQKHIEKRLEALKAPAVPIGLVPHTHLIGNQTSITDAVHAAGVIAEQTSGSRPDFPVPAPGAGSQHLAQDNDAALTVTSGETLPPDDRRLPRFFGRIAQPGVRGKPDAFQPSLDTDLILNIPDGASRAKRFTIAIEALVNEMRREGSGQRRYELENGKAADVHGSKRVYAFQFVDEADIFEDAEVDLQLDGRRIKGQIVSISEGRLLIALDGDFGPIITRCVLVIDNTALLVALKERLEQAVHGDIGLDLTFSDRVLDRDVQRCAVEPIPFSDTDLDSSKHDALKLLTENSIGFLWGPPGTGKTRTLTVLVQAAFEAGKRILICSNTNKAVDQVLYQLCERLPQKHPAMEEGRILRLGKIVYEKLRKYEDYVTADGILKRRSADLKRRQAELEDQIAHIDAQAAETNRLLEQFGWLDRGNEGLAHLRKEIESLITQISAAIAAHDGATKRARAYQDELGTLSRAGVIRRAFMRSEERIRIDLLRAEEEAERQRELERQLRDANEAAKKRYDELSAQLGRLRVELKTQDRKELESQRAIFEKQRAPLVTELQEIARKLSDLAAEIVRGARVIGTTVAKSYLRARELGRFEVVIIDEASMVLLPALYFVAGLSTERVVVSGDFRQLPPIVPSRQQSIHDQIGKDVFEVAGIDDKPDSRCAMLSTQYRMSEEICRLISGPMYDGILQTASTLSMPSGPRPPKIVESPLTIIDTSRLWPFESRNMFGSRFNLMHALLVRNLVTYLNKDKFIDGPGAVGVCTPYAAQAKLLQRLLTDNNLVDDVDAGTVHRYQGDQKRVMILDIPEGIGGSRGIGWFIQGVPPDHVGARLLNVAVSRAQEHLVVFANLTYLDERLPSTALLRHILYEMQTRGRVIDGKDVLELCPIESDLKNLLGVAELDLDAEKFGLFHARSFSKACLTDMSRAKKSIVIFSGFVTPDRVAVYGDLFRGKIAEGIAIRCVTRPPRFNGSMAREVGKQALDALEGLGAVVDCRRDIHEKVVLIDNEVVWSGSLNALSHTARTDEFMTRAKSPLYAEQVAAFLSKRAGLSPSAAAATAAQPENPRCPRCHSRTYYSDGPYGPYFSCEDEDGCGWRESARRSPRRSEPIRDDMPKNGPPCPVCGGATRLRQGPFGSFYGCIKFPKCRGKVNPTDRSTSKRRARKPKPKPREK